MFQHRDFINIIGVLLLSLALSPAVFAQVAGGTISGTVTDSSGGAVVNAKVTILNQATGVTRTLTTNESGFYSAPNLLPGPYRVTTSSSGFSTMVEKLELTVGAEAVVNIQLKPGEVTEVLQIEDKASAIDQASSTLSATVEGKTIRELPLNGRDWTQLATLEPGVSTISTQNPTVLGNAGRANRGLGTQLTVGGARPQQNNYRLDGISINDYSGGGPGNTLGSVLGVEAIQEFSVVTANPPGEYGKTSGGVFNAITRSGANQFHGAAYEFHRNSAFDARNFFDLGSDPPSFKRHQFGGSISGPIRKDRAFFFFDYEGLRESLSTANPIIVPSRAARLGQLTSGAVTVDPKAAPYLNFFPLPDTTAPGDTGVATLIQKTTTTENFYTARADHAFSQADSLHGAFFIDNAETQGPDSMNVTELANTSRRKMISLEESHVFSQSLINTARIGYSRVVAQAPLTLDIINPSAKDPSFAFLSGGLVGSINVSGLTLFPGLRAQDSDFQYNSYQAYDDLFYTCGTHTLKFGVAIERVLFSQLATSSVNGSWQFGSLRNFLTNQGQNFQAQLPGLVINPTYFRQTMGGGYVQDDWHARPNLSLNLGLRYEATTVPTEKYNRLATLQNLTDAKPKLGSPYFQNPTLRDFSPRLGFAWDPFKSGKTSVRGAFGIYDTLPLLYQFVGVNLANAPFSQLGVNTNTTKLRGAFPNDAVSLLTPDTARVSYVEQNPRRSYVPQWNLNLQREVLKDLTVQLGYFGAHGVHQPYRTNDADLVLPTQTADGPFWPTPRGSGNKLNPNVGQIQGLVWQASNTYNALNAKITRRLSHGLLAGLSYTWSKSLDPNSASVIGGQFQNSINGLPLSFVNAFRGPSDFDVRHNLIVNYLWELPAPQIENALLHALTDGWQWGGIVRAQSGTPFTATISGDSLGMRSDNTFNFPDRVNTPGCGNPVNSGNPDHYIKTECFAVAQPTNRLGNAGRNSFTGPSLFNVDTSLTKNNRIQRISETFNAQFRLELFNVLNHADFRPPTGAAAQVFTFSTAGACATAPTAACFTPNATAGRLLSTAATSRQIQLALKLIW
jgi:hypothetical protein